MTGTAIIVIDGSRILRNLDSEYQRECSEWHAQCQAVHARFKKKTSRTTKGGKVFEYTNWYEENGNGGLKSVGKEEPDYTKYYPPEPKPMISFKYREYDGHALLGVNDYDANLDIFKNCLVFKLDECVNRIHPLYVNPEKMVKDCIDCNNISCFDEKDSVRAPGMNSVRSFGIAGQNKDRQPDRCKLGVRDEKGQCTHLTGSDCKVLCCRDCAAECNSRCRNSDNDAPEGCIGNGDCDSCVLECTSELEEDSDGD